MPGVILGSGNRAVEKRDNNPALRFTFLIGMCFCHLQLKQCCLPDHARLYARLRTRESLYYKQGGVFENS